MKKFPDVMVGSVVFSRWQPMVVLYLLDEKAFLCPLISQNEPSHRADMALAWHELAEAGLSSVDVRFRGIVCRRDRRTLQVTGRIGNELLTRMSRLACEEEKRRRGESRKSVEGRTTGKTVRNAEGRSTQRTVWMKTASQKGRDDAGRVFRY